MPLNDGYSPAIGQFVIREHAKHALVPEILALRRFFMQIFLVGEGEIEVIAEIEVTVDDILTHVL
jgi:hypothetical protein